MELELIEPDLYFDYAPDAKRRYIEAIEFVVGGAYGGLYPLS
jgi:hypothetical protein